MKFIPFILLVLFVVVVIAIPFALIWAVNTLFATAIPATFTTWAAALILSAPFMSVSRSK